MKKAQLLSVVFSLIMFTGLTAGTAVAYAESDDDKHDFDDRLEYFCEMTNKEKDQLFADHPRLVEFEERLTGYCELDEDEREELIDDFIEEHFPNYEEHDDWDMDDILDRYCEMSDEDKAAFVEKYPMASDHQDKMDEYCSLDESERDAFIEEHKDSMKDRKSDYKDDMRDRISDHKDSMRDRISDHKDDMKDQISDHKDSMSSDRKSHMVLRASTLTDEQKDGVKAMHAELRDFKHSLRDKSISDDDKQEIRNQFMEKAKEFSMTWISPRHQVAAGIDAEMVECREGFALVMKTSNALPICVKETTAEKLIERGIAISAI
jgi:hypothetical protein